MSGRMMRRKYMVGFVIAGLVGGLAGNAFAFGIGSLKNTAKNVVEKQVKKAMLKNLKSCNCSAGQIDSKCFDKNGKIIGANKVALKAAGKDYGYWITAKVVGADRGEVSACRSSLDKKISKWRSLGVDRVSVTQKIVKGRSTVVEFSSSTY